MKVHTWKDMPWEQVTPSVGRRFITGTNEMISQVKLSKRALVPEHEHESEQISYLLEGVLQFHIAGEELIVHAGQVVVIPPHVPHSVITIEDALAVDVFSPIRHDWLNHTDTYFQKAVTEDHSRKQS